MDSGVRYLKGKRKKRLEFGPGQGWSLIDYCNADRAADRKSTCGYKFFFGTGPIAWSQATQCVSLSAQYVALCDAFQVFL